MLPVELEHIAPSTILPFLPKSKPLRLKQQSVGTHSQRGKCVVFNVHETFSICCRIQAGNVVDVGSAWGALFPPGQT